MRCGDAVPRVRKAQEWSFPYDCPGVQSDQLVPSLYRVDEDEARGRPVSRGAAPSSSDTSNNEGAVREALD